MQGNGCRRTVEVQFMHLCLKSGIDAALISRRMISGETRQGKPVDVANVASGHRLFTDSVRSESDMARWSCASVRGFRSTRSGIFLLHKDAARALHVTSYYCLAACNEAIART
jgi:hypothetical protein